MSYRKLFLPLLFVVATVAAAQTGVKAQLDSTQIFIGSQTRLTLTVRTESGKTVQFPDFESQKTLTKGIEVVRTEQIDTTSLMAGILELRRDYVLTSFDSANYRFLAPPVVVETDTILSSDTLIINVLSVPVDTLHLEQFYGAKDVLDVPFSLSLYVVLLVCSALVFLLISTLLWRKYKSLKPRVKRIVTLPPPAAHELALEKLRALQADTTSFADEAARCDAVVEALRVYIKSRFEVDCSEMTSSQTIDTLRHKGHTEALEQLANALRATDYVRFAGQRGQTVENHDAFTPSFAYVEATKENLPPREPIVTEEVEENRVFLKRRRSWLVSAAVCALAGIACVVCLIVEFSVFF